MFIQQEQLPEKRPSGQVGKLFYMYSNLPKSNGDDLHKVAVL